ncbi:MAG: hypothetical protein K1X88_34435 [Nannocystaceae bacterium]|nr:hypothetical protein [Nannocystaceae bacterium]
MTGLLHRALPWRRLGLLAGLAAAGCSTPASDFVAPTSLTAESSGEAGGESGGDVDGEDDAQSTGDGDAESSSGGDGTTGGAPPPPGDYAMCPEALPEGWVLCEDFEALQDPASAFFEYQDGEGAFVLDDAGGASGRRSMRVTYRPGVEGAGYLSAAFGRNPIVFGDVPQASTDSDFQSVYWRLRVKTQAGWPGVGPGHLTSATSFASAMWNQAMNARLRSDGDNVVLLGEPTTCVQDDQVACSGYEDPAGSRGLGGLVGATPLFAAKNADRWFCVEAHVALNSPGESDGVFEFWVDGELQNGAYDLDWRGSWTDYGINLITIENLWPGGAPSELERSIDDFVISTKPIGCE